MTLKKQLVIEAIGTLFLLLSIGLSANPFAIGITLAVLVYMGAQISGAHYNPAVTLAAYLGKAIPGQRAWAYVGAQFVGAIGACLLFLAIKGDNLVVRPGDGVTTATAILVEIIFTFLLTFTVLQVAVSKRTKNNQYFGLAIGFALLVGAISGGAISGGAYNPAVGIVPAFFNGADIGSSVLIYSVGPLVGALGAGFLFRFLDLDEKSLLKKVGL